MNPNWFVAFKVEGMGAYELPPPPSGIRLFRPEELHLTLAFLGPRGERAAQQAFAETVRVMGERRVGSVVTSLGAVVPMGNPARYSALSALIDEGREALEACITGVRDVAAAAAGSVPDTRAPKAHVTVARPARRAGDAERAAGVSWASTLQMPETRFELRDIALYTWGADRASRLFRVTAEHRLPSSL